MSQGPCDGRWSYRIGACTPVGMARLVQAKLRAVSPPRRGALESSSSRSVVGTVVRPPAFGAGAAVAACW